MILAAAAACFGLLTMTGCEETNPDNGDGTEQTDGNEDGNGENEGDEGDEQEPAAELSIEKQWVAETEQEGMIVKQCFDIGVGVEGGLLIVGVEGGLLIGQYNDLYASMLPEGADPEKSYIAMIYSADEIVSITETNGTSGTVAYKTDTDGDGTAETDMSLSYSNLNETSVTINYTDVYGITTTLDCTVAPEGTKVYTMMDLM